MKAYRIIYYILAAVCAVCAVMFGSYLMMAVSVVMFLGTHGGLSDFLWRCTFEDDDEDTRE